MLRTLITRGFRGLFAAAIGRRASRLPSLCLGAVSFCIAGCGGSSPTSQPVVESRTANPVQPIERHQPEPPPKEEYFEPGTGLPGRTHWVKKGETLYSIARQYYGTENQWRKIYYANDRRLRHPDELPVGIKLIIP